MKLLHALVFYLIYFLSGYHTTYAEQKAVISVPIADILGQQIITIIPDIPAEKSYHSIAMCAGTITHAAACPRLHQLLYNDVVDVLKNTGEEVCIRTSHTYYLTPPTTIPHNQYWTLKKNITYLDDLNAHNISPSVIPKPIDFSDKNHDALRHPEVVTLIEPHYDTTLGITFSIGTRFIKTSSPRKKRASAIEVFAINYEKMKLHTIKIPFHKCIIFDQTRIEEEHITDFVNLLKKWAHTKNGHVPYVWGGTSFTKPVHTHFKEITKTGETGDYSFYEYEKNTQSPKNGFDCTGLILRAAQICGIPYFCKNTTTIAQCLTPLIPEQQLREGDLILIKGHAMIVSDMTKNLLIEARSYGHGYGKLHEIPISQVFDGIETYKDLCNAYNGKKVIKRKDKEGKIRDTFSNVQLFSMMSVWNN